jgi:lipase
VLQLCDELRTPAEREVLVTPFVLVHGLIGSFADVCTISTLRSAAVVCPDLLGYGTEADADPDSITIDAQVEYVRATVLRAVPDTRFHVVGHSVGGVIAMAFAHRFPDRVASVVNVEGNFTLGDAFWSAQIANMAPAEVRDLLEADRSDPARWLRDGGVEPTGDLVQSAAEALAYQPASTIHAMARGVVDFTGRPGYGPLLRKVFQRTPVHLIAGARSRSGWNVPEWALTAAASYAEIPHSGHMVTIEAPGMFADALIRVADSHDV